MTFGFEIHRWRTGRSSDLFYVWISLGFFSLTFSKQLVSEALERMRGRMEPDEMTPVDLGEITFIPHEGKIS